MSEQTYPTCYKHPDRITGLSCTNCGKSICVECSHDASVGQRCPDCAVPEGRSRVVHARQSFGRPSFQTTPVSFTIIAVTSAIFVIGFLSLDAGRWLFQTFAQANFLVANGEWWRIFTAALLHGGMMHLLFNMYALYLFGPRLEQQVGSAAFAALYVATAGTGGMVSYMHRLPGAWQRLSERQSFVPAQVSDELRKLATDLFLLNLEELRNHLWSR